MKKLMYLLFVFCFPIIISAQQSGNMRNKIDYCIYRDSIMKMILPQAEQWRLDYNNKSKNQISPFTVQDPEVISTNEDGNITYGIVSYSATFQKEIGNLEAVDSLLFISINSTCDEVTMFSRQIGKAGRQNIKDKNIFTWKEIKGTWQIISHFEAFKSKYRIYN